LGISLEEILPGVTINGLHSSENVTIIHVSSRTPFSCSVVIKSDSGRLDEHTLYKDEIKNLEIVPKSKSQSFSGSAKNFLLAAEAYRIKHAHIFDTRVAIHTSNIKPLPHQISAVYEVMLQRHPLRFLLADDPGAGKTIMAGLLIKELIFREDVKRCLIVCPGNLEDQWELELKSKFALDFEKLPNLDLNRESPGIWLQKNNFVIARLDKLSRNELILPSISEEDCIWDLVIFDEAHKLSASQYGKEIKKTKRFILGEALSMRARHFLLMTATPHNGKNKDFQLFLSLLDPDRFENSSRRDVTSNGNPSDLIRRMVKEELVDFKNEKLFPERDVKSIFYELSVEEKKLYKEVTQYVINEFNRADKLDSKQRNSVGFALTILQRRLASSPKALTESLRRRIDRLKTRLDDINNNIIPLRETEYNNFNSVNFDDFYDETPGEEIEVLEGKILDGATTATSQEELALEIEKLQEMLAMALAIGDDKNIKLKKLYELVLSEIFSKTRDYVPGTSEEKLDFVDKLIVFTEHVDTLHYLEEKLKTALGKDQAVVYIKGGMNTHERLQVQEDFLNNPEVKVLVATDAAGEGINLQKVHLMINYDLPWNPNRLEQRFGRIHRIGQKRKCTLWNLIAEGTREGEVFKTLLEKLEEAKKALGGKVFDILGQLNYQGIDLKELLVDAIRGNSSLTEKEDFSSRISKTLAHENLKKLIENNALTKEIMDFEQVNQIRQDMEIAKLQRLQPHFVKDFFIKAFKDLGGDIIWRKNHLFEIPYVPLLFTKMNNNIGQQSSKPISRKYARVSFEGELDGISSSKHNINQLGPGHPLLDAVVNESLRRYQPVLEEGTIFVDEESSVLSPEVHMILKSEVYNIVKGQKNIVSTRLFLGAVNKSNKFDFKEVNFARYLDFKPLSEFNITPQSILSRNELNWVNSNLVDQVLKKATDEIVFDHKNLVQKEKESWSSKVKKAVEKRLQGEISYWNTHYTDLLRDVREGKKVRETELRNAKRNANDLAIRLENRMNQLKEEEKVFSSPPALVGIYLVLPKDLLVEPERSIKNSSSSSSDKMLSAEIARNLVMKIEESLGNIPKDVEFQKKGYDIESIKPNGDYRLIEVKGRSSDAKEVTFTTNEINFSLNQPENYIIALVEFSEAGSSKVYYSRNFFENKPDVHQKSSNYSMSALKANSTSPELTKDW